MLARLVDRFDTDGTIAKARIVSVFADGQE
jgi:hypothetical protein